MAGYLPGKDTSGGSRDGLGFDLQEGEGGGLTPKKFHRVRGGAKFMDLLKLTGKIGYSDNIHFDNKVLNISSKLCSNSL